jgi:arylsulfatase A-like enzyme
MRAIFLMFDSLNRHWLPAYGGMEVDLPNFRRLAERTVTFDQCHVGSMPCMPARRELHTGRYNFLHRGWGPLEPFDESMPALLDAAGVHTHLVTDHQHYWEDGGGGTYHNRFSTYEFVRGQEGDRWKGRLGKVREPAHLGRVDRQDLINRAEIHRRGMHPQEETISLGLDFLEANAEQQNWFVQIETFDPHEPFFAPERHRARVGAIDQGPMFDWPKYQQVTETDEAVARCRREYAALLSLCDESLGRVLDTMDRLNLWEDTLLIVGTDHGFLLGEHEWWAKCKMPFYNEIARTPFFVWDPRSGKSGERCDALVQLIDLPPTLLDLFEVDIPASMRGRSLATVMDEGAAFREAALFGMFGSHLNITDGRYVLMQAPATESELNEYTLMPTRMRRRFTRSEMTGCELLPAQPYSNGFPVLKVPSAATMPTGSGSLAPLETMLFDRAKDPQQNAPFRDAAIEQRLKALAFRLLVENEAPAEVFARYGLKAP